MITVKKLRVKVTYNVGLGDIEMPEQVRDQLIEASEKGDDIEMSGILEYQNAYEWLSDNIRERDCMDWSAEIVDVS